jgi:hypothetical protein
MCWCAIIKKSQVKKKKGQKIHTDIWIFKRHKHVADDVNHFSFFSPPGREERKKEADKQCETFPRLRPPARASLNRNRHHAIPG